MKTVEYFVFDTNVVISAMLFSAGKPSMALKKAFRKGRVVVCDDTLEELFITLLNDKFEKYVPLSKRITFFKKYKTHSECIKVKKKVCFCRDAGDDKFLSLAVNAKAAVIISGDNDLLVLNPFRNILILSPSEFLKH